MIGSRRHGLRPAALSALSVLSALFGLLPNANAQAVGAGAAVDAPLAPRAWFDYAQRVSTRFEAVLAGDAADARRVHARLAHDAASPVASSPMPAATVTGDAPSLDVNVWIGPRGAVTRIALPSSDDAEAADDLRRLLVGQDIGAPPPRAMRQPVRVRLRVADPPAGAPDGYGERSEPGAAAS